MNGSAIYFYDEQHGDRTHQIYESDEDTSHHYDEKQTDIPAPKRIHANRCDSLGENS